MTIVTSHRPYVPMEEALHIERIDQDFWRIDVVSGFMQTPNVPAILTASRKLGWKFDIMQTSFLLSRRSIKVARPSAMSAWRAKLFAFLANNSLDATDYFRIPKDRVVEIGTQVGI